MPPELPKSRQSIVVLARHGYEKHALINHLSADHEIVGIVFEDRKHSLMRVFLNRLRRLRLTTVLNQLLYKIVDELAFKPRDRFRSRRFLGESAFFREKDFPRAAVVEVSNVNSDHTIDLVGAANPDFVVVSGVSLLGEKLLESIGNVPVLNIHCGITPRYRGSHGAYWAVVNNDWENAGTTVHFIDRGVDTGPIVGQQTIELSPNDDPRSLAFKQNIAGMKLMAHAIDQITAGDKQVIDRPDLDSRLYLTPTFTSFLRFRANLKRRFSEEPHRHDALRTR